MTGPQTTKLKYFAMLNGERKGPYTLDELASAGVTPETYVWCKGMKDWEKAEEVADICRFFRQRIAALQHPGVIEMPGQIPDSGQQGEQPASYDDGLTDEERKRLEEIPIAFREMVRKSGQIPTQPPVTEDTSGPPSSWVALAVLATIFCCPVIGFIAIYFAFKSRAVWRQACSLTDPKQRSDMQLEAHRLARQARIWTGITVCAGLMIFGFFIGIKG